MLNPTEERHVLGSSRGIDRGTSTLTARKRQRRTAATTLGKRADGGGITETFFQPRPLTLIESSFPQTIEPMDADLTVSTTPSSASSVACGDLVRIPVLIWAEIAGKRFEVVCEATVRIGQGHCPELAREIFARPMAETLADISIKTGWELCDPNTSEQGGR